MSTILTVSELTHSIKNQLEKEYRAVTVQGEISNFKPHSSGHLYFDLKDAGAKIPAVLFRGENMGFARAPKEGDQVIAKGALSVYAPHGKYQLIVRELQFAGIGALLLKLEELKKKLKEKGWFDSQHKKPLPRFPRTIGVVTSPTGAVIRDIIHILSRRFSGFHLVLNPVRVQGAEAAQEIAAAIDQFNRFGLADVLIVGRGGGSLEDLWPFNEEIVAEAIFRSQIPIISAVGHESDVTIADFVADLRAPTPSAAAEIVISEKVQQQQFLQKTHQSLGRTLDHLLKRYREKLAVISRQPFISSPYALLGEPLQKIDEMRSKLEGAARQLFLQKRLLLSGRQKQLLALKPTAQLSYFQQKLGRLEKGISHAFLQHISFKRDRLRKQMGHLSSVNPKNVLSRGYSILFDQNKSSVIVSTQELNPGKTVRALLSDGEAVLTVEGHE